MTAYDGQTLPEVLNAAIAYSNIVARTQPWDTPLLSRVSPNLQNLDVVAFGAPGASPDGTMGGSHRIQWAEDTYKYEETTVNGAIGSGDTTLTVDDPVFQVGMLGHVNEEVFTVTDVDSTGLILTITRSTHTGAAAAIADGAIVLCLGKPYEAGAGAPAAGYFSEPGGVTNYGEVFIQTVNVASEAQYMAQYYGGDLDKLGQYTLQADIKNKQDLENTLVMGKSQASSGATPGKMDGIYERLISANSTDMGGGNIEYTDIQAAMREKKRAGAYPSIFCCSLYQEDYIHNWGIPHVLVDGSDAARMVYGTNVVGIRVGGSVVDIIGMRKFESMAMLLSPENIKVGPRHAGDGFHVEPLAKLGRTDRLMVSGEYSCQVKLPGSHELFTDVASS